MRAFLALVSREIHERLALLAAAAAASILPLVAPVLPATGSNPPADIREAVMWVMVLTLVPIFALLLGVSFIGRDLAEGRLGFYYAQPLSGPTIWFGKLAAVLVLVWTSQLVIMLPTAVLSREPGHLLMGESHFDNFVAGWLPPSLLWGLPAGVVLVAHAIGIVWRARSAWLVVDFVVAVLAATCAWAAVSPFVPIVAPRMGERSVSWLVAWAVAAFILGGAMHVTSGRIDLRRSHKALSITIWTLLGFAVVTLLGYSLWVRSVDLADVDGVEGVAVGPDDWIAVGGRSAGRMDFHQRFLVNLDDGRRVKMGPEGSWHWPGVVFSEDGSRAAWVEYSGVGDWPIMFADLTEPEPKPLFSGMTVGITWGDFAISSDGNRLALLEDQTVSVHEIDPPRQVAAATIDRGFSPMGLRFSDEQVVWVITMVKGLAGPSEREFRLVRFDAESRHIEMGAGLTSWWRWWRAIDDDHAEEFRWVDGGDTVRLVKPDPEAEGEEIDFGEVRHRSDVRFMSDGRVLIIRGQDGEHHLDLYSAEGSLIRRIDLPDAETVYDGGEVKPGVLLIGLRDREEEFPSLRWVEWTVEVDLSSGQIGRVLEGVQPVLGFWMNRSSLESWSVGSTASHLLEDRRGILFRWQPETNDLVQIIPVPD
jgi:hypothetical protein